MTVEAVSATRARQVPWTPRLAQLTHVGIALTGVVTTLLGPLLPALATRWSLADGQLGALFGAQFFGSLAGSSVAARVLAAVGLVRTILLGLGLAALGVTGLAWAGFQAGLLTVFVFGFGLGLTGPGFNLWVTEAQAERRAAALSLLNMAWAIGATSAPPVVALLSRLGWPQAFLPGLALLLVSVAVGLARAARVPAVVAAPVPEPVVVGVGREPQARMLLFAAVFFIYVGIENAIGGWAAMSAKRLSSGDDALAAAVPSLFWGALVLGRGLAPLALRRHDETHVGLAALGLAAVGTGGLLAARSARDVSLAVTTAGLGLAPVFPLTLALLARALGARAAAATGPMFALGACGGALVPWAVGAVSTGVGSLRAGLIVTLVGALALFCLYGVLLRDPRTAPRGR